MGLGLFFIHFSSDQHK
uniref:Uncharacterized protein n=1 Tax=Arundo donax TaxID=35708 RepID=A0A0A9CNQ8_ARUDO